MADLVEEIGDGCMRDLSYKKTGEDKEGKEERNAYCGRDVSRMSSRNTNGTVVSETKKKGKHIGKSTQRSTNRLTQFS